MAYDAFGTYISDVTGLPETEEERRKRLGIVAPEDVIKTTEVKTYGDGTQEQITKQQIPAQPVSPDMAQIRQIESGNRDFTATGEPVTSPKGAMFASQVMPATAANPGFGVRPAQSQTPEEYNRVGQDYYNAMMQRYGNNREAAAAAYNAGPGTVDRNMAANNGQLNVGQLPQETQGYLQRFAKGVGDAISSVIPSAQAGELTPEQRRQQVLAQRDQMRTQPLQQPAPQPTPQPAPQPQGVGLTSQIPQLSQLQPGGAYTQRAIDQYQSAQDDVGALIKLRDDTSAPQFIRERARERAYDLLKQENDKQQSEVKVQQLVQSAASGDRRASLELAKTLQQPEGSWAKMILLGFISPELAGEEAVKLGFGNKWKTAYDAAGNVGMIEVNAKGLPLRGVKADGSSMDNKELIQYAGGGQRKLNIVGGSYVNDQTGEVGRMVTDEKTGVSYIQTDTGRKPMQGFRPQASTGTLADMRARALQDLNIKLQGKGVEEQMAILRPYNQQLVAQGYQPIQPAEVGIRVPQVGAQQIPAPQQAAPAPAPAAQGGVAPVAPAQAQPAPVAQGGVAPVAPVAPAQAPVTGAGIGGRPTGSQLEAQAASQKKTAEVTGEDIGKLIAQQPKVEQNADYLISKVDELITHPGFERSVGLKGPGMLFGLRDKPIPGTREADWMSRFEEIGGRTFLEAFEGLRGGGQITEKEGEKATQALNRMRTSTSEEEFRLAAKDFTEIVKRAVDKNRGKLGQQPKYGIEEESKQSRAENKPLSKEDQQAIEWARNNPNDPRAAEIKKRLGL